MGKNKKLQIRRVTTWAVSLTVLFCTCAPVLADKYDDAIAALQQKVNGQVSQIGTLKNQADSLQNKVAIINSQIDESATQLELAQAKGQKLADELEVAKAKLDSNKQALTENVRVLYENGDTTAIEVLASSDNLSDFIDRREYLQHVSEAINKSIDDINATKAQLERDQVTQAQLVAQQKSLQYGLSSQRGEASSLLADTQGQESVYQSQVQANKAKIKELQAAQAAEIASRSSGQSYYGTGSYPWAGYAQDSGADPWGFYYRECTSYAAWKRASIGRPLPAWGRMGYADAKTWVDWGRNSGYRVDHNPEVGAVGVYTGGYYGHVMIVKAVTGSQVLVSQYNADMTGRYSESYWSAASLWYIH